MLVRPPIYGLDIVVDTSALPDEPDADNVYLLDPTASSVVAAGISTIDGDEYYDGDERRILAVLDQRFAVLDPGIITTWNGSLLDLPFLRARARALRLGLGLRLRNDRRRHHRRPRDRRPAPSVRVGDQRDRTAPPVSGAWHRQRHLDLRWVYGDPTAADELLGMDPRRGAHLARSLAERRWARARRHLDRIPPQAELDRYTWTSLALDAEDGPTVTRIPASAKARHPSSGTMLRR
ncbi:MAG: hypothetical protein AAF547_02300 [Actinomycetota bacterium]